MKLILVALFTFILGVALSRSDKNSRRQSIKSLSSKRVSQIGLVVKDIEKSTAAYAALFGVESPDIIISEDYEKAHTQYDGRPTPARAKLAFFQMENITIELIEPIDGPSTWRDHVETHGDGIHHIAFDVENMDEQIEVLEKNGGTLIQRGDFTGGCYSYIDLQQNLGTMIELLAFTKQ